MDTCYILFLCGMMLFLAIGYCCAQGDFGGGGDVFEDEENKEFSRELPELPGNQPLDSRPCTTATLGIETDGGVMTPLVPKGTRLPAENKEIFSTATDNQIFVTVQVYQGEGELVAQNTLLDDFILEGISPATRGVPQIEVTFSIDVDEQLSVSAKDLTSGKVIHVDSVGFEPRGGGPSRPGRGQDIRTTIQVPFHAVAGGSEHELLIRPDGEGGRIERVTIKIPAGIQSGTVLRLNGQGGRGTGGCDGDLYVTAEVCDHPWFRRDGDNLLLDVPVTPAECELGAKIEVPTLAEGTVVLSVPAGSSNGSRLRLRGMGLNNDLTGGQGDQLVVVKIVESNEVDGKSPRDGLW